MPWSWRNNFGWINFSWLSVTVQFLFQNFLKSNLRFILVWDLYIFLYLFIYLFRYQMTWNVIKINLLPTDSLCVIFLLLCVKIWKLFCHVHCNSQHTSEPKGGINGSCSPLSERISGKIKISYNHFLSPELRLTDTHKTPGCKLN